MVNEEIYAKAHRGKTKHAVTSNGYSVPVGVQNSGRQKI